MAAVYTTTPYFDYNNPKYRFCCCHIITGGYFVCVMELVGLFAFSFSTSLHFANIDPSDRNALMKIQIAIWFLLSACMVVAVCCTIYAMRTQNYKFVFPLTIMQGVYIFVMFCWFIVYVVALAGNESLKKSLVGENYYDDHVDDNEVETTLISAVIGTCVGMVVQGRFIYVTFLLRRFLRDKDEFDRKYPHGCYDGHPAVAIQASYVPQYPYYGQPNQYPVPQQAPPYNPYAGPDYRVPIN